jgi:MutS domain V
MSARSQRRMSNPLVEYTARLSVRRAAHERWVRLDGRLSHSRLATAAVAALLAWLAYFRGLSPWWIAAPVATFLALAMWHDRIIRARDLSARSVEFYARGIARIEERWAGGGEPGSRFLDDTHLYARDLDLFGPGSLFELLSTARTRAGEDALAGWLRMPSPLPDLRMRQQAVEELRDRLDFREAIALAGAPVRSVDTESLTAWAASPPILRSRWPRLVAIALTATAVAWGIAGQPTVVAATILVQLGFARAFRSRVEKVLHGVEGPSRALDVLAQALVEIERQPVASKRLTALKSTLSGHGPSASAAIGRLHRLVELHDWQHNLFFSPIAFVLMWSMHVAWALERWRREIGASVPEWIRTLGEYEAVIALASYAYEHPSDPFPTFIDYGPAAFHGVGLRHPLVPAGRIVPNDVRLDDNVRLLVVSGSNMSGKSTLLRTVGTNAVLALAGAPVRATSVELTFLRLGATLRIEDSLRAGRSRFYAEIARIREIADLAREPGSLMFLFDELFQGTNSNDRAAAAAIVLRTLVERHAIGLVTTHDLALTRLVDDLNGRAVNAHFEDRFDQGELRFDYLLKPGPATRGNAMALLRMVGLDE